LGGGLTSKIHTIVDALGNPLTYEITAGHIGDCVTGYEMLQSFDVKDKNVVADRGYDTNAILNRLAEEQSTSRHPQSKTSYDPATYRLVVVQRTSLGRISVQ